MSPYVTLSFFLFFFKFTKKLSFIMALKDYYFFWPKTRFFQTKRIKLPKREFLAYFCQT